MKVISLIATVLAVSLGFGHGLQANPIEQACLRSDRDGVSRAVCACVGDAAELTLTWSDMRTGARFFTDLDRAQDVQLSDTRRDDAFWDRWQSFGNTAEALCG